MKPQVDIHLIVKDGEKYIRECVEAVGRQGYPNIKFRIFDNGASDRTVFIAKKILPSAEVVRFEKNYGLGGGFNRSLALSKAPYIALLSVDVVMSQDFVAKCVETAEKNRKIGVIQGKILQDIEDVGGFTPYIRCRGFHPLHQRPAYIDTTGLEIYRSRRVVNRGHGEKDEGQYNDPGGIFCYEGAVPFFRRSALEEAGYLDEDFWWYADELDLGWRLRLLGWENWYEPKAVAWHDRQTTKKVSGNFWNFIRERRKIPVQKRLLDYRNQRLAFIKNDFLINFLKDLPHFLLREILLFFYFLVFEQTTLPAYWQIVKITPKMLKKRRKIMARAKVGAGEIKKWFK